MEALLIGAAVTIVASFGAAWLGARLQRKWTPNPIPSIEALGGRVTALQERMEAIENERAESAHFALAMQLRQANVNGYILEVRNDTDQDVAVMSIQFFRGDAPLSGADGPNPTDDWRIPAHSGKQLCWSPQPDPVRTLQYSEPNLQGLAVPFRIVLTCQSDGKPRNAQRTLLLTVDYRDHKLTQYGP